MTRETGAATATESLSASLGKTVGATSHRRLQIVGFRSEMHVLEGFVPHTPQYRRANLLPPDPKSFVGARVASDGCAPDETINNAEIKGALLLRLRLAFLKETTMRKNSKLLRVAIESLLVLGFVISGSLWKSGRTTPSLSINNQHSLRFVASSRNGCCPISGVTP
jgi:hypothetical protein